ncbi:hypothetical protein PHYSODRAFT_513930 [Phytophthora sojae]|uniref:Uncharacterized protein n=1 Tax=Phytophthora sojae (strain P6497) TaxID=1094619 RepID=G4ZSH1_PHYSP|nr:hypothetical protein PHYSODRAFT_513930 [Phytophthora sojae]EGZ14051.1 hypothetical protein PHYSODRAFT_513930 [Phytophthora sojae]|eukprot:XP_009531480.1 hypothetical protein PHYSODRAFT_513930 [Phytophthora sojae]
MPQEPHRFVSILQIPAQPPARTATTMSASIRAATVTDPSIFEILFKQKDGLDNPQEEAASTSSKAKEEEPQLLLPVKQPTLLADLHLLQQLTQQLQAATLSTASNNHDDDDGVAAANAETESLATLYCRRAAALLAFVDYDVTTTVPLDILASGPSSSSVRDEANQPAPMLEAVRQALQDAQAAAALSSNNATIAEAHLLSANCSRSLGELAHARAFAALAAAALPGSYAITSLAEQLDVEARADTAELLPKLRLTSAAFPTSNSVSIAGAADVEQEEDGNNNDQPEQRVTKASAVAPLLSIETPAEQSSFWHHVAPHFQTLEEAANSPWLEKLERLMHQNVHHRCAQPNEVRQLDAALQAAFAALALLLQSSVACSVLGLDMRDDAAARTLEKLTQTASSSPQTLVQNRTTRKWIVCTWAPIVRLASSSPSTSPLTDLSNDVLVMLARLLQASGSWRRCTAMGHSLAYAEMGFDLAKILRESGTDPATWSRLELQCAEAFATALLQRSSGQNEALKTFRDALQGALHVGDHEYELRARLHVAKTLRLMEEPEIAHAELDQLLVRCRALNDVHMEAMAEYEMGEHFVQQEDLETAHEHFRAAQTLCNRTANCGDSWRPRSIQQAIAFYARLRLTARRGAMRCSVSTLLRSVADDREDDSDESEAEDDSHDVLKQEEQQEETQRPKERRQAFYLKRSSPEPRSLMSTIMSTTGGNSLSGPKPKRTMTWRESVFTTAWPAGNMVASQF